MECSTNPARPRVVVLDSALLPDSEDCLLEQELLSSQAEVVQAFVTSEEETVQACRDADAIILWHHVELSKPILEKLRFCRIIVRNGVGYDNVDVNAAAGLGMAVCNVPDYGTEEVADHAMALALCLARRLLPASSEVRQGRWNWRSAIPIRRFREQVFGILGCGRIGTCTALRARAFGFQVTFFDPYLPDGVEKSLGIHRAESLESLLRSVDILSIHVPLTAETRRMIRQETLALLKPGAVLVNTARGPVVDEDALAEALDSGRLAGAGLDVVEDEARPRQPLSDYPQCLVTPHSAFYSEDSWREMRTKSCLTVVDALLGKPLRNVVNGVGPAAHLGRCGPSRTLPPAP